MKFSLDSILEFESNTRDEALFKLAMHFISQMDQRPVIIDSREKTIDIFDAMIKSMPSLNEPTTDGYIDVDIHGDFDPPEMMQ